METILHMRGGMIAILVLCILLGAGVAFSGLKIRKQSKLGAIVLMVCGFIGILVALVALFNTMFATGFN